MPLKNRIYIVNETKNTDKTKFRLVRATTKTVAIRHVADSAFVCEVAGQEDLIDLISQGLRVENALEVPAETPALPLDESTGSTGTGSDAPPVPEPPAPEPPQPEAASAGGRKRMRQ